MAIEIEVERTENPAPAILALVNPISKRRTTNMARTAKAKGPSVAELQDEIENLRSENLELQETLDLTEQALDEANSRLSEIGDSAEPVLPEDFEDSEDSESEEGEEDRG